MVLHLRNAMNVYVSKFAAKLSSLRNLIVTTGQQNFVITDFT